MRCVFLWWYDLLTFFDVDVQIPHHIGLSRKDLKGMVVDFFDDDDCAFYDGLICNTNVMDFLTIKC